MVDQVEGRSDQLDQQEGQLGQGVVVRVDDNSERQVDLNSPLLGQSRSGSGLMGTVVRLLWIATIAVGGSSLLLFLTECDGSSEKCPSLFAAPKDVMGTSLAAMFLLCFCCCATCRYCERPSEQDAEIKGYDSGRC